MNRNDQNQITNTILQNRLKAGAFSNSWQNRYARIRFPFFGKQVRTLVTGLVLATIYMVFTLSVSAKDIVTITSEKTAVIDKNKGTAVWRKNVTIVQESTGSNLLSDRFTIRRNAGSDEIVWAEAVGKVKAVYFRPIPEPLPVSVETKNLPHTIITCHKAIFSRDDTRVKLSGDVQVRSMDAELDADAVAYDYRKERGKITAAPGEQVSFVFYKKTGPDDGKPGTQETRSRITGEADEIRFDRGAGKAILQGSVRIDDHAENSHMKADRSELFFNEQEEIETVVASGRFFMKQPARTSRADRALFDYRTEEVTLIGNAYVKEDDNMEISSARIQMYMKVDKGIISGYDDVPVKMKIEIK